MKYKIFILPAHFATPYIWNQSNLNNIQSSTPASFNIFWAQLSEYLYKEVLKNARLMFIFF